MNHQPNGLRCVDYALDGVTNPMDGYLSTALASVSGVACGKDERLAQLESAYMLGCALLHAAEWLVDAMDRQTAVIDRAVQAVNALASAFTNDVAPAISLLGDELAPPLDRIADNTET